MPPTADPAHLHARVHTHTRATNNPTHMPVYTHPHMPHALTNLHLHMRIHTHTCHTHKTYSQCTHTCTNTRTHAHTNLHTRTCRHEYTGTHANRHGSGARPCAHACTHTHAGMGGGRGTQREARASSSLAPQGLLRAPVLSWLLPWPRSPLTATRGRWWRAAALR